MQIPRDANISLNTLSPAMLVVVLMLFISIYSEYASQLLNKYHHGTQISPWLCHTMGNQELLRSAVVLFVVNFWVADMLHN